jgi:hypothetical protein
VDFTNVFIEIYSPCCDYLMVYLLFFSNFDVWKVKLCPVSYIANVCYKVRKKETQQAYGCYILVLLYLMYVMEQRLYI